MRDNSAIEPDPIQLKKFLEKNGMEEALIERVVRFFDRLRKHSNPYCHIGHAYFLNAKDRTSLNRVWNNQLMFHFKKAFKLDHGEFDRLQKEWRAVVAELPPEAIAAEAPVAAEA